MKQQYDRTSRIIGEKGIDKLGKSRVLVFGVGGVGSYVCEGLARAGIGALTIVDKDVVDITNINRQIPALHSTIGRSKTEVMARASKISIRIARWRQKSCFSCLVENQTISILHHMIMS